MRDCETLGTVEGFGGTGREEVVLVVTPEENHALGHLTNQ